MLILLVLRQIRLAESLGLLVIDTEKDKYFSDPEGNYALVLLQLIQPQQGKAQPQKSDNNVKLKSKVQEDNGTFVYANVQVWCVIPHTPKRLVCIVNNSRIISRS